MKQGTKKQDVKQDKNKIEEPALSTEQAAFFEEIDGEKFVDGGEEYNFAHDPMKDIIAPLPEGKEHEYSLFCSTNEKAKERLKKGWKVYPGARNVPEGMTLLIIKKELLEKRKSSRSEAFEHMNRTVEQNEGIQDLGSSDTSSVLVPID